MPAKWSRRNGNAVEGAFYGCLAVFVAALVGLAITLLIRWWLA